MITETFSSFFTNIKQKTTNPFLGTLIIVWSICNWKLLYTFFTFDSNTSLETRIANIENYVHSHNMLNDLGVCILESIVVLIITYALLNLSRIIINLFENIITPRVYKLTKPSSIVTIDTYNFAIKQRDDLSRQFDSERADKLRIQADMETTKKDHSNELSRYIQDNHKLMDELNKISTEKEHLNIVLNTLKGENEKLINKYDLLNQDFLRYNELMTENAKLRDKYTVLEMENKSLLKKTNAFNDNEEEIFDYLIKYFESDMNKLAESKEEIFLLNKDIDFTKYGINNGILKHVNDVQNSKVARYTLTPFGTYIRRKYIFNLSKENLKI